MVLAQMNKTKEVKWLEISTTRPVRECGLDVTLTAWKKDVGALGS